MARKRLVLAEDHTEMADHLRSLLGDYDVDIVSDGQGLIAAVDANVPDIIISDIAMPGISGLAAARDILAVHPNARIIFVSVRDEPAIVRKAIDEGAAGYVVKSDAGDELVDAVQTVLGGGQYVSSSARAALKGGP
ncbi:response regulator transcription factor [Mesorhizobium sp. YC-39]|uniref:response regulator n=1 Tax=unclassified Mesorhizobium TaxID=325217 RepID=UPI0021E8399A|nr:MULTISPECIES: response regulator transcription factor [unclassified Mesorhizobium]MCV3211233.1 response regulator transcription factor [Mesorhizobium sp. YC-2]MCV3232958.1 response regulator transcription factor [Mesorhizobium sp. YC-39]